MIARAELNPPPAVPSFPCVDCGLWTHSTCRCFWNGVKPVLDRVFSYVANQVKAFDWPGSDEMLRQYVTMMCLWWKLGRTKKVAATLWGYARAHSRTEAVRFPSRDTGATNKKVLMWKEWWRLTHTDPSRGGSAVGGEWWSTAGVICSSMWDA